MGVNSELYYEFGHGTRRMWIASSSETDNIMRDITRICDL